MAIEISTDPTRLDFDRVHAWLTVAYWSEGRTMETVEKAAKDSLNFGAYYDGEQVGYARVVTDFATFAWVCDVVVDVAQHDGVDAGFVRVFKERTVVAGPPPSPSPDPLVVGGD